MDDEAWFRAATLDDLQLVIAALNEQGAEYLLIGGFAMQAHGIAHATTQIDLLVPATIASGECVRRALLQLPDQVAADIEPSWFEEGEPIRVADQFVLDIQFKACGQTYQTLLPDVQTLLLADGTAMASLSLEGLLKTRQGARPKERADRLLIEAALKASHA